MDKKENINNPLGEVFGFPTVNTSKQVLDSRNKKICPFNHKTFKCTKDKINNPLGVCSIREKNDLIINCPVRFREKGIILENAANFFFGKNSQWSALSEIRLKDQLGHTTGNIDYVLVSHNKTGQVLDFGSLEVQSVYISGNLRNPFESFMNNSTQWNGWKTGYNYPKPDYLSSSRKRLIPQILYKGGIFKSWGRKQAVVLQKIFFDKLPLLPQVTEEEADIAWFLYDLIFDASKEKYRLTLLETIYTQFEPALNIITQPNPSNIDDFLDTLQVKLNKDLKENN